MLSGGLLHGGKREVGVSESLYGLGGSLIVQVGNKDTSGARKMAKADGA
jgi:hypothetical protein